MFKFGRLEHLGYTLMLSGTASPGQYGWSNRYSNCAVQQSFLRASLTLSLLPAQRGCELMSASNMSDRCLFSTRHNNLWSALDLTLLLLWKNCSHIKLHLSGLMLSTDCRGLIVFFYVMYVKEKRKRECVTKIYAAAEFVVCCFQELPTLDVWP